MADKVQNRQFFLVIILPATSASFLSVPDAFTSTMANDDI